MNRTMAVEPPSWMVRELRLLGAQLEMPERMIDALLEQPGRPEGAAVSVGEPGLEGRYSPYSTAP